MDILLRKLRCIDNSRSAYNDVPLFTSYYALQITDIVTSLFHTYACHSVVLTGVSDPPQCGTDRGEWSPSVLHSEVIRIWKWNGLERGYTITLLVQTLLFFSCGGISLLDSLSSVWEHGIVEYHYTCFISVYWSTEGRKVGLRSLHIIMAAGKQRKLV